MSLKILVVEDEPLFAEKLQLLLRKLGYDQILLEDNSDSALLIIENNDPDLIIMDINIPGKYDGVELAEVACQNKVTPIIYITSYNDNLTFNRAANTSPCFFLVKPFSDIQLQRSIELAIIRDTNKKTSAQIVEKNEIASKDFIFIKKKQKLEKVHIKEVLYLESEGHYCKLITKDRSHLIRMPLAELARKLPRESFIFSHRSFLVNIEKVDAIDLDDSTLKIGEKHIPLSKRNKENFLSTMNWI